MECRDTHKSKVKYGVVIQPGVRNLAAAAVLLPQLLCNVFHGHAGVPELVQPSAMCSPVIFRERTAVVVGRPRGRY